MKDESTENIEGWDGFRPLVTGQSLLATHIELVNEKIKVNVEVIEWATGKRTVMIPGAGELFGHVKCAFSGAPTAAAGVFRAATGGTLLLDEVAELSLVAQAKLLRALETKTVRPVGGTQEVAVDVRIVAATHRDLHAAVKAGTFRADLFARLDGPTIEVPTLRARPTDLPALFVHFLAERRALDGSVEALFRSADARAPELPLTAVLGLLGHTWPRNVRELARYVAKVAAAAREVSPLIIPSLETRSNAPSSPSLAGGDFVVEALPIALQDQRAADDDVDFLRAGRYRHLDLMQLFRKWNLPGGKAS